MFFFLFVAVPEPVAFYPLNARYKATEKENRQQKGILGNVTIASGPYNEPGGAYMFYGTGKSYIEFLNDGSFNTRFSTITLMCWVQPGGQDGPLFIYDWDRVGMSIVHGKFVHQIEELRSFGGPANDLKTTEVLPIGKWVHVAASYDHNTGNNSLYINGHFSVSQNRRVYEIATTDTIVRMGSKRFERVHFKGKIAEMKVYDVALNEAQIQASIGQGSCTLPVI